MERDWDLISSYAGLLSLATFSIYAGSFSSLKAPRKQKDQKQGIVDEDSDDEDEIPELLSSSDAYWFPVLGSVTLFGLYLVVKFLGKEWINYLLGWYFTVVGVGSVWKSSISLSKFLIGSEQWKTFSKYKFLMLKGPLELVSLSFRTPSLILFPLAIIPSAIYTITAGERKSAILTDILALSFSHSALSVLKIDSFQTGSILLAGLFFYDIWWVFGTEVMVKVATSLDVPIKILWPKSLAFTTERGFTMLGLGDIVIPGLFITLALRYDLHRSAHKQPSRSFAKPYFTAAISAYVAGLATTMGVMHFFKAAQPALLYLSPACILSFVITSLVRGEFKSAWEWKDEIDAPSEKPIDINSLPDHPITIPDQVQENGTKPEQLSVPDGGVVEGEKDGEPLTDGDQETKAKKKKSKKK
ncbi:hypothetical protein BD410DRAFT_786262 [Rickenella mellea]|uniref:Peptidase A22B, signal peptide peptidase n=1 Tax=Rickenella mellea TaxID=50990 RepID=A0A4Y7Q9Y2_9AGAM|nr:hypothetical protein BD410DRAFT_786262 [Rickenella mellea]